MSRAYECIEFSIDQGVALIALNAPQSLNAISAQMASEVIAALDQAAGDAEVRATVVAGNGRAFSSGYDLGALTSPPESVSSARLEGSTAQRLAFAVWEHPKVTVAGVHGYCLAGACELAMMCDITIAGESTVFGEPEIRFASASPVLIMPWIVPMKVASELLLTGSRITAARAYEVGMINRVVKDDELRDETMKYGRLLAKLPAAAVQLTKRSLHQTYEIMGLIGSLKHHREMAAIIDGDDSAVLSEFASVVAASGVRAALDWTQARYEDLDQA